MMVDGSSASGASRTPWRQEHLPLPPAPSRGRPPPSPPPPHHPRPASLWHTQCCGRRRGGRSSLLRPFRVVVRRGADRFLGFSHFTSSGGTSFFRAYGRCVWHPFSVFFYSVMLYTVGKIYRYYASRCGEVLRWWYERETKGGKVEKLLGKRVEIQ